MGRITVLAGVLLAICGGPAEANPVIAGDHPDPTVARIGGAFYASSTAGSWAPLFPIFRSTDLVSWTPIGALFAVAPRWTAGKFWAPELTSFHGHAMAFYSAARHPGRPCIGVATAARPDGLWRDRGRAVCPPRGEIDPAPVHDAGGRLWLAYKQFGVGGGIYLQALDRPGLRATGIPIRLVTPDARWERHVTEGPAFLHSGGWWYLFYSGGTCCRVPCSYAEGVARARTLQGPYAKDPANPILTGNAAWKCPGHGTVIDVGARGVYLLHHAYARSDAFDARREVLLDRVTPGAGGWPVIADGRGPATVSPSPFGAAVAPPEDTFSDGFDGTLLGPGWEWPFDQPPRVQVGAGRLKLACDGPERFVAHQVPAGSFAAVATLDRWTVRGRPALGLTVNVGAELRGIELAGSMLRAIAFTPGSRLRVGAATPAPPGRSLRLVLSVAGDGSLAMAAAGGGRYVPLPAGPAGLGLSPTRVALTCRGRGAGAFTSTRVRAFAR